MINENDKISLQIKNNTALKQPISILGGIQSQSGSANANTEFLFPNVGMPYNPNPSWYFTVNSATLQVVTVPYLVPSTYVVSLKTLGWYGVAEALNTLGLGFFAYDSNGNLVTYSSNISFQNLSLDN